jgi:predicted NUDIX family NTP pyrophosphohydrolase
MTVYAWAVEGDCDASAINSNSFTMEWPPRSGQQKSFPEIDRAERFDIHTASEKILKGQSTFLEQLLKMLI